MPDHNNCAKSNTLYGKQAGSFHTITAGCGRRDVRCRYNLDCQLEHCRCIASSATCEHTRCTSAHKKVGSARRHSAEQHALELEDAGNVQVHRAQTPQLQLLDAQQRAELAKEHPSEQNEAVPRCAPSPRQRRLAFRSWRGCRRGSQTCRRAPTRPKRSNHSSSQTTSGNLVAAKCAAAAMAQCAAQAGNVAVLALITDMLHAAQALEAPHGRMTN